MGYFFIKMNVFVLLFLSFFILLSSLSENFEFLVHNEESLLILCFIAFIFFAYNFLSVGFYDDFQKRVFDLEQQLVLVASSRFNVLLSSFNELLHRKDLVLRFPAPFLFGDSKLAISLVSHQTFMRFIKKAMFSENPQFFHKSITLKQL